MIAKKIFETCPNRRIHLCLVAAEKPLADRTSDDKMLTAVKKLREPNDANYISP